jgi:hypothetical protein
VGSIQVHDFIVSSLEEMLQSTPDSEICGRGFSGNSAGSQGKESRIGSGGFGNHRPCRPVKISETLFRPERAIPERTEAAEETAPEPERGFFSSLTILGRYLDEHLLCLDI